MALDHLILIDGAVDIAAAVENSVNRYGVGIDVECDRHAPFKTDEAQAWPKIVTPRPAFSGMRKSQAIFFNPTHVTNGAHPTGSLGNIVVQLKKVRLCLRRKDDVTCHALGPSTARRGAL